MTAPPSAPSPPFIALELRTTCGRCDAPIALGGLAEEARCPKCGDAVRVVPEAILGATVAGREGQIGLFGTGGGISGRFGPAEPACGRCGRALALDGLFDGKAGLDVSGVHCVGCGAPSALRAVPEPWRAHVPPGFTHLLGERSAAGASEGAPPERRIFYLWAAPAEALAPKRPALGPRAKGALLALVGLALLVLGVALWMRAGAGLHVLVKVEWASSASLLVLARLSPALVGAILLAAGLRRFGRAFDVLFGLLGLVVCVGAPVALDAKGFDPWLVAALAAGAGWLIHALGRAVLRR